MDGRMMKQGGRRTAKWLTGWTDSPLLPLSPWPRHNDLPWQLLKLFNNQLLLPASNLTQLNSTHTNIPKLNTGHVGGQVGRQAGHGQQNSPCWGSGRSPAAIPPVLVGVRALRHAEQGRGEAHAGADRCGAPHV